MSACIIGLGVELPERTVSQRDAAAHARTRCVANYAQLRLLDALYRRSGVEARRTVLAAESEHENAGDAFYQHAECATDCGPGTAARMKRYAGEAPRLAIPACRNALENACIAPDRVSHLITVSCTGFSSPGFDIRIMQSLDLAPEVARSHIGFMGCHGVMNGLRVARAFVEADPDAVVLLCAVELCSLHFGYGWDPQQIVANALFADGAAAAVIANELHSDLSHQHGGGGSRDIELIAPREPSSDQPVAVHERVSASVRRSVSLRVRHELAAATSLLVPLTEDAMTWTIGDHGFRMTLSPRVPDIIHRYLAPWLTHWLDANDLAVNDIASWAIHPGGPRVLDQVGQSLELTNDQLHASRAVLARCGNMSSPSVLFILNELNRHQNRSSPTVMLAFGPGLTIEAALLR